MYTNKLSFDKIIYFIVSVGILFMIFLSSGKIFAASPTFDLVIPTSTITPTPTSSLFPILYIPPPSPTFIPVYLEPATPSPILPTAFVSSPPPSIYVTIPSPTPTREPYWVFFGPAGLPNADIGMSWATAEDMLDRFTYFGYQAEEIDRWVNGGWDGHIRNLPFNNFTLNAGKGYFIKFLGEPNVSYSSIFQYISPISLITYQMSPGWNDISFPENELNSFNPPLSAESLCRLITVQGGHPVEIDNHNDGENGFSNANHYTCGVLSGDFPIHVWDAYFIKVESAGSFQLLSSLFTLTPTPTISPSPISQPLPTQTATPTPTLTVTPTQIPQRKVPSSTVTPTQPTNTPTPTMKPRPVITGKEPLVVILKKYFLISSKIFGNFQNVPITGYKDLAMRYHF